MPSTDYIPARDAQFAPWLANFASLITAGPIPYGLTAPDAVIIQGVADDYADAYAISSAPATRTSGTIATTRGLRLTAEATVRPYAMRINANQSVSNAQRLALGITVRTLIPTPIPPPITSPALMLQATTPGQHLIQYRDSTTPTSKSKPYGVVQLEVWRLIGIAPAGDPLDTSYLAGVTKSPVALATPPGDAGKTVTYYGRWVTRGGPGGIAQVGPWSAPLVAIAG